MNRIASYAPEAEGFETSARAPVDGCGTGEGSKINAESPSCTPGQAEGEKQLAQVAQGVRDSGRDSETVIELIDAFHDALFDWVYRDGPEEKWQEARERLSSALTVRSAPTTEAQR